MKKLCLNAKQSLNTVHPQYVVMILYNCISSNHQFKELLKCNRLIWEIICFKYIWKYPLFFLMSKHFPVAHNVRCYTSWVGFIYAGSIVFVTRAKEDTEDIIAN